MDEVGKRKRCGRLLTAVLPLSWLFVTGVTGCDDGRTAGSDAPVTDQVVARAPAVTTDAPASSGVAQAAGQEPATRPTVAILGDSIAAGLHLPADQAFPAVLARRLASDGFPIELVNAGVSGDTTAGGLRRVDWLLRQKPEIVVVELGANDGMRGQPVVEVENNLRAILTKVRAAGAQPLLLGIRLPPSYGAEYVESFAAVYPRVAAELEVPFVPFFMRGVAGMPELNLPDGIHPTQQGHARLAENVRAALATLVAKARAPEAAGGESP